MTQQIDTTQTNKRTKNSLMMSFNLCLWPTTTHLQTMRKCCCSSTFEAFHIKSKAKEMILVSDSGNSLCFEIIVAKRKKNVAKTKKNRKNYEILFVMGFFAVSVCFVGNIIETSKTNIQKLRDFNEFAVKPQAKTKTSFYWRIIDKKWLQNIILLWSLYINRFNTHN